MQSFWSIIKSILWIILETIVFVAILTPITALLSYLGVMITGTNSYAHEEGEIDPYIMLFVEYIPLLTGAIISLYITHRLIFNRPFQQTGFIRQKLIATSSQSALIAIGILLFGFVSLYLLDYLKIVQTQFTPELFVGFLLLFLIQSSFEEVVSRSFMIPSITARSNVWVALFISSSTFAILHLTNPNISAISTINIFLAGLVMGLIFLLYKSVWPAISFHAAWNFFQGSFFGFEVSGYDFYSLIDSEETGPDWLTGGLFGFEGSMLATILLLVYAYYLYITWQATRRNNLSIDPIQTTLSDHSS